MHQMRFLIPGAFHTSRRFDLESIPRSPRGSRVMSRFLVSARGGVVAVSGRSEKDNPKTQMAYIPLHPSGRHRLGTALLHAKSAPNA